MRGQGELTLTLVKSFYWLYIIIADISDDKLKLYTKFDLINLWYDVGGDPVPTAIAECEITYSINKSNDKIYLQFENIEIVSKID